MRPIRLTLAPSAASATNLAASQSPGTSALTLTALAAGPIDPQTGTQYGLGRIIIITSGGNDTGISFAVVGKDANNVSVTENITGANAGVAASTNYYTSISSITPSAGVATTVTVGTRGTTSSAMYANIPLDMYARTGSVVQVNVTGTISYTVEQTFDNCVDPTTPSSNVWFATPASPTALTAQSTSKYTQLIPGVNGLRVSIPTYSTSGSITVNVINPSNTDRG